MVNDLANLSRPWKDPNLKCENEEAGGRGKWDLWVWAPSMQIFVLC